VGDPPSQTKHCAEVFVGVVDLAFVLHAQIRLRGGCALARLGKSKISGVDRKISMYVDEWRAEEEKREAGENPLLLYEYPLQMPSG